MTDTIQIFWPGDYRDAPNQLALPLLQDATSELETALDRLGRKHNRIPGFMTRPHEVIKDLGQIHDPMIGCTRTGFTGRTRSTASSAKTIRYL